MTTMEKTNFVFLKEDILSLHGKPRQVYGKKGDVVKVIGTSQAAWRGTVYILESPTGERYSTHSDKISDTNVVVDAPKPKPVAKEYVRVEFDEPPPARPIIVKTKKEKDAKPAKPIKPPKPQQGTLF